jgi:hypothetical protein
MVLKSDAVYVARDANVAIAQGLLHIARVRADNP